VEEDLAWVKRFHDVVDELAADVAKKNVDRLVCRAGCAGCCTDGLTVFEIEAARICDKHRALVEEEAPHPEGACAFLDANGRCRVYDERPYVCRTQGLPLRWIEADDNGSPSEVRDICPLNDERGPPLEELPPDAMWSIGPFEARLRARSADGKRVALRDLFRKRDPAMKRHLAVIR
jgi:hypothetical protein